VAWQRQEKASTRTPYASGADVASRTRPDGRRVYDDAHETPGCPSVTGTEMKAYSYERRNDDQAVFCENSMQQIFTGLTCWDKYDTMDKKIDYTRWADHFVYHIRYCLCNGDAVAAWTVLMIILNCVHRPEDPIQQITTFQGKEGTGKSRFWVWVLSHIIGNQHSITITDLKRDIAGQFNGLLKYALVCLIEESVVGKNQDHTSILNQLITGKRVVINSKGLNQEICCIRGAYFMCTNSEEHVTGSGSVEGRRHFINRTNDTIASGEHQYKQEFFDTVLNPLIGNDDTPNQEALDAIIVWLLEDPQLQHHLAMYHKYMKYTGAIPTKGNVKERIKKTAYKDPVQDWLFNSAREGTIWWPPNDLNNTIRESQQGSRVSPVIDVEVTRLYRAFMLNTSDRTHTQRRKQITLPVFKDSFIKCSGLKLIPADLVKGHEEKFNFSSDDSLKTVREHLEKSNLGLSFCEMKKEAEEEAKTIAIWDEVKRAGSIWKSPLFKERYPLPEFDTHPGKEVIELLKVGEEYLKKQYKADTEDGSVSHSNPPSVMDYSSDTDNTEESVHASTYKRPLAEEVDEVVVNDASGDEAIFMENPHKRKHDAMGVPLNESSSEGKNQ